MCQVHPSLLRFGLVPVPSVVIWVEIVVVLLCIRADRVRATTIKAPKMATAIEAAKITRDEREGH